MHGLYVLRQPKEGGGGSASLAFHQNSGCDKNKK